MPKQKQLEIKAYSIKNGWQMIEHKELYDFDYESDKDGNLKSFEFVFQPITGVAKIIARMVDKK